MKCSVRFQKTYADFKNTLRIFCENYPTIGYVKYKKIKIAEAKTLNRQKIVHHFNLEQFLTRLISPRTDQEHEKISNHRNILQKRSQVILF